MENHVHVAGLAILTTIATVIAVNFLVRTVHARHPDNPILQGLAYSL